MGTETPYDRRMPKAKWTPDDETEQRIADLVAMYRELAEKEAAYRKELAQLAKPVGPVPIAHLAERLDIERKTVYRHLGRSMT
jgi:predicted transcriptional regulator